MSTLLEFMPTPVHMSPTDFTYREAQKDKCRTTSLKPCQRAHSRCIKFMAGVCRAFGLGDPKLGRDSRIASFRHFAAPCSFSYAQAANKRPALVQFLVRCLLPEKSWLPDEPNRGPVESVNYLMQFFVAIPLGAF